MATALGWLALFAVSGVAVGVGGRSVALVTVGLVVVVTVWLRPQPSVLLLLPLAVVVPPLFKLSYGDLPDLTAIRFVMFALGLAVAFMPRSPEFGKVVSYGGLTLWALAFSAWVIALTLFNYDVGAFNPAFVYTVQSFIPVLLVVVAVRSREALQRLTGAVTVAIAGVAGLACFEALANRHVIPAVRNVFFHAPARAGQIRIQGTFPHPIILGCAIALVLPLVVAGLLTSERRRRWYGAALVVMLAALALTFSRGPWAAAVAGLLVFGNLLRGNRRRSVVAGFIVTIVVVSLLPLGGTVTDLARSALTNEDSAGHGSTEYRALLLDAAIRQVQKEPMGVGPGKGPQTGMYGYRNGARVDLSRSIDNAYLILAIEVGIPGLLLFLALLCALMLRTYRSARRLRDDPILGPLAAALVGSQVAMVLVSGTVATYFTWEQLSLLFWLLAGASLALERISAIGDQDRPTTNAAVAGTTLSDRARPCELALPSDSRI